MKTPQWVKKLSGHAGELYVAAELSKRGILNALLPENFSDDDILIGTKDGVGLGYIQVKSCHPDRGDSFRLSESDEKWTGEPSNKYVIFVWLGSPRKNEPPRYWIATKKEVGSYCIKHSAHGTSNPERRFFISQTSNPRRICLKPRWLDQWGILDKHLPV